METIERVHYHAARKITGTWKGTSANKLYKELGWETLSDRRWKRRIIQFFKIYTVLYYIYSIILYIQYYIIYTLLYYIYRYIQYYIIYTVLYYIYSIVLYIQYYIIYTVFYYIYSIILYIHNLTETPCDN